MEILKSRAAKIAPKNLIKKKGTFYKFKGWDCLKDDSDEKYKGEVVKMKCSILEKNIYFPKNIPWFWRQNYPN